MEGASVVVMMRGTFLGGSTEVEREELPDLSCLDLLRWLNKDISRALRESREAWCLRLPCADELLETLLAVGMGEYNSRVSVHKLAS